MPAVHIRRDFARAAERESELDALVSLCLASTALGRKAVFCAESKDTRPFESRAQEHLRTTGMSSNQIKEKKDSLMATLRGHLRKKKASIRSGAGVNDIYKPIWFVYEYMESFISPVYECQSTINTQDTRKLLKNAITVSTFSKWSIKHVRRRIDNKRH
ncbi:hypothetical protein QTP88_011004 [Uroleucon formosanum]